MKKFSDEWFEEILLNKHPIITAVLLVVVSYICLVLMLSL